MSYYSGRMAYRYFSKLDATESFDTARDAAAFDLDLATSTLLDLKRAHIERAIEQGDESLARALRFLADEMDLAALPPTEPETP